MHWESIEGRWKLAKGRVKEKWSRLTDDDLNVIDGRRDRLEGKIQQRYGFAIEHVRKEVDDWVRWQVPARPNRRDSIGKTRVALATTR
jgi:uncharacterized protein YjbJ (UPF0337 family)